LCFDGSKQPIVANYTPAVSTINIFFIIKASQKLATIDFTAAYLNATCSDTLQIYTPWGIKRDTGIIKLNKSLYGAKNSGYEWYLLISDILIKMGLKKNLQDNCIFYNETITIALYVDDLLISYQSQKDLDMICDNLKGYKFKLNTSNTLDFLGLDILQKEKTR